jgi:hypothetical protein
MIGVRVRTYEAKDPVAQAELMKLTIEELGKAGFPASINVLIGQTKDSLTVIAIEPLHIPWNWPGDEPNKESGEGSVEKSDKGFGPFAKGKQLFLAKS